MRQTTYAEARSIAQSALREVTSEGVRRVHAQARERLHLRQLDRSFPGAGFEAADATTDSKKRETD